MSLRDDPGSEDRRRSLGGDLRVARAAAGWSVEEAAAKAGLGHMTYRRLEDGHVARPKTYAAIDTLHGLPVGTTQRAVWTDEQLSEFRRLLGVVGPAFRPAVEARIEHLVAQIQLLTAEERELVLRAFGRIPRD